MVKQELKFTKNDIWRALGFIMVIAGQFFSKENYSLFGATFESNLIQLSGALLLLFPFVMKAIALYQGKKDTMDTQG